MGFYRDTGRVLAAWVCVWVWCLPINVAVGAGPGWGVLDDAALIDGLGKQGMGELIEHLDRTQPTSDPVLTKQIEIAKLRVAYRDEGVGQPSKAAAFNRVIDATNKLIEDHRDHEQRPMWQTDLGEMLLFEYLPVIHQFGAEFYEFGVPTTEQREAFESVASEALIHLVDADRRFYQLRTELPRQADHQAKRVDTGLWDRMVKQYHKGRTAYYLAHAAYYTALLDNEHTYYKNLGDPRMPRQQRVAADERRRLLDLAIDSLKPFVEDTSDQFQIHQQSVTLTGRALLMKSPSEPDEGQKILEDAEKLAGQPLQQLIATLARARSLDGQGMDRAASNLIARLAGHPAVSGNLLLRILVVDLDHRLKLARAQTLSESRRAEALAEAYAVYDRLLADAEAGAPKEKLRAYLYKRWAADVGEGVEVNEQLPAAVLAAVAELSRAQGQNLAIEAEQLELDGKERPAAEKREQAQPKLGRAMQLCRVLLARPDLTETIKAEAMFNLAMATYYVAEGDVDRQVEAANIWTDLAEQTPDQPIAEEGIGHAITVLNQLHQMEPPPMGVAPAYHRTAKVLFEKHGKSAAAHNERLYYGVFVLARAGDHAEAADILWAVPSEHVTYFVARREALFSMQHVFEAADKVVDVKTAKTRLAVSAEKLRRDADAAESRGGPQPIEEIRSAAGWARLVEADIAAVDGDTTRATGLLDEVQQRYNQDTELISGALSRGIVLRAQVGDYAQAVTTARQMMERFPDNAAGVIDEVLGDLEARVQRLRRQAEDSLVQQEKDRLTGQALGVAQTTEDLARLLLDWAKQEGYAGEELVPFELSIAESMRLAGKPDGAIARLKPLMEQYGDSPGVMNSMAESLFATGNEAALIDAANRFYDVLISGLENTDDPQLKRLWWNAWMRRLQISDKLGQSTDRIPLSVRQLKLVDEALGGEPFRSELNRLSVKYAK